MTADQISGAEFSTCGAYRRRLWRVWDEALPILTMAMLNPSKAGAVKSDPTVTRQIERAKRLGCGSLFVVNAFDLVATDPRDMKRHAKPLSAENDDAILASVMRAVESGGITIAAWGPHAKHLGRHEQLLTLLKGLPLHSLIVTADGTPGHPLYLPYSTVPQPYPPL